jgi:hypothetical protein
MFLNDWKSRKYYNDDDGDYNKLSTGTETPDCMVIEKRYGHMCVSIYRPIYIYSHAHG